MAVTVYTDLFNTALTDLTEKLQEITGLTVTNDPRNLNPPTCLISAPSFEAFNNRIVKLVFNVQVMTLGAGNLDAERSLLSMCAKLLAKNVAVTSGRPTSLDIGGTSLPAYELIIAVESATPIS